MVAPVNYSALTRGIEVSESHFAIAESLTSNSSIEREVFVYMASTPEETARHLKQQAQTKREQLDMIYAHKNLSIPSNRCFHSCLKAGRSQRPRLLLRSLRVNGRKGRAHLLFIQRRRNSPTLNRPSLRPKREAIQRMGALILKR